MSTAAESKKEITLGYLAFKVIKGISQVLLSLMYIAFTIAKCMLTGLGLAALLIVLVIYLMAGR